MKTVYIPAGATYNYETLVTDNVIVHGHLHVTNGLKAKHISGRGFITAGEVSTDIVDVTEGYDNYDDAMSAQSSAGDCWRSASASMRP